MSSASGSIRSAKIALRKSIRQRLQLHGTEIVTQLSQAIFEKGKRVFIPKVTGPNPTDMEMFEIESIQAVNSLPKSSWGIPEPTMEMLNEQFACQHSRRAMACDVDLILVPGVAFDVFGRRLGQGRGYYDAFFKKVAQLRSEELCNLQFPFKLAVAFDEQIVPEGSIPTDELDEFVDAIITPDELIDCKIRNAASL